MSASRWDAIVIGSGVGGLTTAAYLSALGRRVLVLEAQGVIGGAAQTFRRQRVFEFDTGAHYIGDCEPDGLIPTSLRGLGLDDVVTYNAMDVDEFDRIIGPGLDLRIPRGWEQFEARLTSTYPADAAGIHATLTTLRRVAEAMETLDAPPVPSPVSLLKHPRAALALLPSGLSLEWLLERNKLSEEARIAVGYICMFLLLPRTETSIGVYAYGLNHYIKSGGWFVRGGVAKIPHSLARVIRAHGGAIRTRARVEKVLVQGGRALGVRLDSGEELHADVIVSNADIKTTYASLVDSEHTRTRSRERFAGAKLTPTLFSAYVGVDIDLREHLPAQHTFALTTLDHLGSLRSIFLGTKDTFDYENLPIWITSATVKDTPPPGTEGYSSIEVTTGTPQSYDFWGLTGGILDGVDYHQHPAYLAQKQRMEDLVVSRLLEVMPFLEGHIVYRESSTMLTHEDWTGTRLGAWAGLDFSTRNMLFRPGPKTEIEGLFIAGASSRCAGAMAGTIRGGVDTASAVIGRDLWSEVKRGAVYAHELDDTGFTADGDAPGFHRLRVSELERHTEDSVVIGFEVPGELQHTYAFSAGQHLVLRGLKDGDPVRRSYSICEPEGGPLRIGVKQIDAGLFSTHAVGALKVGDVLNVSPPRGAFSLPAGAKRVAAIAAGSGITPIRSILATALERDPDLTCALIYGNRTEAGTMFRAELADLQQRFPGRFAVEHVHSREGMRRRVDRTDLERLDVPAADAWLVCGPAGLVHETESAVAAHGIDPARVQSELFDTAPGRVTARGGGGRSRVALTYNGSTTELTMSRAGDSLLDEAVRLREDLPYSCMSGSCGSCRARVTCGEVHVDDDGHTTALSETEAAQGFVLTCLSRPLTETVALDFDQAAA